MTFDEAVKIAKANPGQGIREKTMSPKWKVVWINFKRGEGDLFCINPHTGSDYRFTPTDDYRTSKNWGLI